MAAKKLTPVNIDSDLHARARAAVRIVQSMGQQRYSLAQFMREAVTAQLRAISRDYNDDKPIGPDAYPLPPGRTSSVAGAENAEREADRRHHDPTGR